MAKPEKETNGELVDQDSEKSEELQNHREIIGRHTLISLVLASVVFAMTPHECGKNPEVPENPAFGYLGDWKGQKWGDRIGIKQKFDKPLPDKIVKLDQKEASLLLPISIDNIPFGRDGGIYRWNGKLCMILWCNACRHNIVMALQKKGETIEFGMPKGYNDYALGKKMIPAHTERDYHYNPEKWVDYSSAKESDKGKK